MKTCGIKLQIQQKFHDETHKKHSPVRECCLLVSKRSVSIFLFLKALQYGVLVPNN
jgi:hypothetical protein